jgi:tellurium resistance protein TerD
MEQKFRDVGQLAEWLKAGIGSRSLCNGWVDHAGELHLWSENDRLRYVSQRQNGNELLLSIEAVEQSGQNVRSLQLAVTLRASMLHLHPLESFWSQRAFVPAFASGYVADLQGPWPVSALGLKWLTDAQLSMEQAVVTELRDDTLKASFLPVTGWPLSERTFTAGAGTLERVALRSWPNQLPQWKTRWHIEADQHGGPVDVWDVAAHAHSLGEVGRRRVRSAELHPDTAAPVWVALTSSAAQCVLPEALSVFCAKPSRRRPAHTRASRPVDRPNSLLVVDADRFAARVWLDRVAVLRSMLPQMVPHSPHVATRLPYGDWFVHHGAADALRAPEAAAEIDTRARQVSAAAEMAASDVISGIDHYLDVADHSSGKLELAVSIPAGCGHQARNQASRGPIGQLQPVTSSVLVWTEPPLQLGAEASYELSTAAMAAAGSLVSCSRQRGLVVACVIDMRGDETHLVCIAEAPFGSAPVVLAQERLSVGLLTWAHAWFDDSHGGDLLGQAMNALSSGRASGAAVPFYQAIAQAAGTFIGLTLASHAAMAALFQSAHQLNGLLEPGAAWGELSQVNIILDGWGFMPLWVGSPLPPAVVNRHLRVLVDAANLAMKGSPADGTLVQVSRPTSQGPRYLLDAYYAGRLPLTMGAPGGSHGPVGAEANWAGGRVEPSSMFDGTTVDGLNPQMPNVQWRLAPLFTHVTSQATPLTDVAARGRAPWAVIFERALMESVRHINELAIAAEASQPDALARIAPEPRLAPHLFVLRQHLRQNPPSTLTMRALRKLGVTARIDIELILGALNPPSLADLVCSPTTPAAPPPAPTVPAVTPPAPSGGRAPETSVPLWNWLVGASPQADLLIGHDSVAEHHAELLRQSNTWWIRDLRSASGTFVNEERIGNEVREIRSSDSIRIGNAERFMMSELADAASQYEESHLSLSISIGSAADCDVQPDGPDVAALHAALQVIGDRFILIDKDSAQGTWMNGQRIARATWPRGVEVHLGRGTVLPRQTFEEILSSLQSNVQRVSGTWVLGSAIDCQLPVQADSIAPHHLKINAQNGVWQLLDLGSATGVQILGAKPGVLLASWRTVEPTDWVQIGDHLVEMSHLMVLATVSTPEQPDVASPPARPATTLHQGGNLEVKEAKLLARLTWAPERLDGSELDVSAFLLTSRGKVRSDHDFVFYGAQTSPCGTISLRSEGAQATIEVDLARAGPEVDRIAVAASLAEGASFSVAKELIFTLDGLAVYPVQTVGALETAMIVAEIYKRGDVWKVRAVGQGFRGGLGRLAVHYGVDIES